MYERHELGKFGEEVAENYLINNKYLLIQKNFRCNFGEIDIIARDVKKDEIVFIEVKTRKNTLYGNPAEAVDERKRKHIFKTAQYFLYLYNLEHEYVRIDVIEVFVNTNNTFKINHIKQAF